MRRASLFALFAVALPLFNASAQPPAITHSVPMAVPPGAATDVTLLGAGLVGSTGIWTNLPGTNELTAGVEGNNTKADQVLYRFTVPPEAAVGVYGLRIGTGQGISTMRLLMVDDLPTVNDNGNNKTVETAQEVTLPVAIEGTCEAESLDFYKLTVAAGQRISVDVYARRLGYLLDPSIRLFDATTGNEVAYSDDEAGIAPDCRFTHQFAAAGTFILEIRDIRYQGGATHRYRIRLGDFPFVVGTFPMGARRGSTPQLIVAGPNTDAIPPLSISVPMQTPGSRVLSSVKFPSGTGASGVSVIASDALEQVEIEPNDTGDMATGVSVPAAINGRIDRAGDKDYYQFNATTGQRFVFTGKTRSLGSPADLYLSMQKADGGVIAEAEDSGTEEGILDFTAPADGAYRLVVEHLYQKGGAEQVYRIDVDPYRPGFALNVEAEKYDVPQGGVLAFKVLAARKDYNGPITISLTGVDGVVLANNVIPEGQAEVIVSATFPATYAAGQRLTAQVYGEAKINDQAVSVRASTLTPLRVTLAGLSYPPADLDGQVGIGVAPVFPDFFQLALDAKEVPFPEILGTTSFKVKLNKLNGFDDKVTLAISGLPPGIAATVPAIEKGQAEAVVTLTGPGSLAPGDYPFVISGSSVFQNQPRSASIDGALRTTKPLAVSVAPAGPIAPGGKQKVKVSIVRHGGFNGAVSVELKILPTGVTAASGLTIAEGQSEIEVELSSDAATPVGPGLIEAKISTQIGNRKFEASSKPAELMVKQP